jgi:hypothetical protein
MRAKLERLMIGRNGSDDLSRFVAIVSGALMIVSMFGRGAYRSAFWILAIVGLIYCYFRIFSRNYDKRREENTRYLEMKNEILSYFLGVKERFSQRKDYKFFRCPSCHAMLRVPRGKGKVKVICRKCGTSFVKKT